MSSKIYQFVYTSYKYTKKVYDFLKINQIDLHITKKSDILIYKKNITLRRYIWLTLK